jgi:hypothetical protein
MTDTALFLLDRAYLLGLITLFALGAGLTAAARGAPARLAGLACAMTAACLSLLAFPQADAGGDGLAGAIAISALLLGACALLAARLAGMPTSVDPDDPG